MPAAFARHELVWFAAGAAHPSDDADRAEIEAWCAAGRPAIVRTVAARDRAGEIPLGIPLPLDKGRRRIALTVSPDAVTFRDALPDLETCWPWAPHDWQPSLRSVASRAAHLGIEIRVHGSLGWQVLTNLTYLRPQSDIDLLLRAPSDLPAGHLGMLLRDLAASDAPRFDGEVELGEGGTVAFRELLADSEQVLVKRGDGAVLVRRAELDLACI